MDKRKPVSTEQGTAKVQVIRSNDPNKPIPPSAAKFIPHHDKESMADVWLAGRRNLFQLSRSNRIGMLVIEDAIRTICLEKLRRNERLQRNLVTMTRKAA
jgi:hypothetical protein